MQKRRKQNKDLCPEQKTTWLRNLPQKEKEKNYKEKDEKLKHRK